MWFWANLGEAVVGWGQVPGMCRVTLAGQLECLDISPPCYQGEGEPKEYSFMPPTLEKIPSSHLADVQQLVNGFPLCIAQVIFETTVLLLCPPGWANLCMGPSVMVLPIAFFHIRNGFPVHTTSSFFLPTSRWSLYHVLYRSCSVSL